MREGRADAGVRVRPGRPRPWRLDGEDVQVTSDVGIVIIGRNEGKRLERSLASSLAVCREVVYVDSGSTDGSVELARARGARVVELDASRPHTAARGRNAGLAALTADGASPEFVQFLDGDCRLDAGWIPAGRALLAADPGVGIVMGRRREIAPGASLYNRLCDMEWDGGPDGRRSCGGDALVRACAFAQAGGYDERLVAGEDPEFYFRVRAAGWRIVRLEHEMTRHDADLRRFGQWWRRCLRSGHAYAECHGMHRGGERLFAREVRSNWIWGCLLPLLALFGALLVDVRLALLLLLVPLQVARIARRMRAAGRSSRDAWAYAAFCVLGKLPAAVGQLEFHVRRLLGRRAGLIEYKHGEPPG